MALALLVLCATTSAYVYGDAVRLRARSRLHGGAAAAWSDCRQTAAPRFRIASQQTLRGVPLPQTGASLDTIELALAADDEATAWLRLSDNAQNLTSIDVILTHDGARVVYIDATGRYGEPDRRKRDERRTRRDRNQDADTLAPAAFAPAVRINYRWRADAAFRDADATRSLVLWGGVFCCLALVYVTLRGGGFDELEDHEAGSDSDDAKPGGGGGGAGPVRRRR
jgi:hypothetical protein